MLKFVVLWHRLSIRKGGRNGFEGQDGKDVQDRLDCWARQMDGIGGCGGWMVTMEWMDGCMNGILAGGMHGLHEWMGWVDEIGRRDGCMGWM